MERAELIAWASPPCHDCGNPVHHIEVRWHLDGDGNWQLGPAFMVCTEGHRVFVEWLP